MADELCPTAQRHAPELRVCGWNIGKSLRTLQASHLQALGEFDVVELCEIGVWSDKVKGHRASAQTETDFLAVMAETGLHWIVAPRSEAAVSPNAVGPSGGVAIGRNGKTQFDVW